jgi:TolB-like protein/cytochrome c-type biogenesis protein CcmH/NrfG
MSSDEPRAVFISYSSEDVEAAQRIANALQEAGIEVWFDRSELRGGDAWDQNIRRQIKECALFLPIISATTERRTEGYFRLEWRLADNRTHHMGRTKTFLVPVCIDASVNQSFADVPDSFLAVHWTLLPNGEPNQGFVDNVKTLLSGPTPAEAGRTRPSFPFGSHAPVEGPAAPAAPAPRRWLKRLLIGGAVAVVLAGIGFFTVVRKVVEVASTKIAVLPFDDLSDTPGSATNFANGLQEAIINHRALTTDFTVVPRTSVAQYRENPQPIPDIARKLLAGYFVYGTVTRAADNKAEVTVSLITGSSLTLWNKTYSQLDLTDPLAARTTLANAIATDLKTELAAERDKAQLAKKATGNVNAYAAYQEVLTAFARGDRITAAWLKVQERKLQGVVSAAPELAAAWGQLAVVHSLHISQGFDTSAQRLNLATESIDAARELDPGSPDTLRAEGIYLSDAQRDYPGAIAKFQELQKALPNSADSYGYLGAVYRRQGRWQEAQDQLRTATNLDSSNFTHLRTLERLQVDVRNFAGARQTRMEILRLFSPVAAGRAGRGGGPNDFTAAIPLIPERPEESYRLAVILLRGMGATAPGDKLFAEITPEQAKLPRFIGLQTDWLRLTGHLAEAIALDAQQPAFGDDGEPAWRQAIDMAAALAANNEPAKARTRLEGVTAELQSRLLSEPGNVRLHSWLGLAFAVLNDKDNALRAGNRAVELVPETLDAAAAAEAKLRLAIIQSWVGDIDAALAGMTIALSKSGCEATIHSMKTDPWFARMRADPRFAPLLTQQNHATLVPDFGPTGGRGGGGRGDLPFGGRGGGGRGQPQDFGPGQGGRDGTQQINGQPRGGQRGNRQGVSNTPPAAAPAN